MCAVLVHVLVPHAPQPVSGEPVSGHVIDIDALYLLLLSVLHAPCSSQDYRLDLDHSRTYPTRRPPLPPCPPLGSVLGPSQTCTRYRVNSMPLPRATSCFLRPSSPLPFHAQVSHSFPTDPFVSSAAGVCFGRYRPRGPRPLFIARCRRPSDFDAASTILEAGIETSNCCWNRRRARYRFSWARLKS